MKTIICLYGGPGTGKSTTAAHLFALLKQSGINSELVTEYVKDWVWEGREIKPGDQYYLLAKQMRRERMKFKDVNVIVTDSPVWLSCIYEELFEPEPHLCGMIVSKHVTHALDAGFEIKHIFLKRLKIYNPIGRFQTESEAKGIDDRIKNFLLEEKMPFTEVVGDNKAAETILGMMNAGTLV